MAPRGTGGRKVHALEAYTELVDRLLASKRDITLDELRLGLIGEGVLIGRSSIDRYLKARGLTCKKDGARRRAGACRRRRPCRLARAAA